MKICAYKRNQSLHEPPRLGILLQRDEVFDTVLDANWVWAAKYQAEGRYNFFARAMHRMPPSLYQLLNLSDDPLKLLWETYYVYTILESAGYGSNPGDIPLTASIENNEARLCKPLDQINTYRDFYTHEKHVKAGFEKRGEDIPPSWYEMPVYYKGTTSGFIGPGEKILWPSFSDRLDYELELGAVIAKEGINIPAEEAFKHVFGFTILNDISARDIQKKEMSVRLGPSKGKDFCSVIGPVITTRDEFILLKGQEPNFLMQAFINGDEWSKGHSRDARFSWAEMIAHASQEEWILPGDLFGSGTVGTGCGLELNRWIQPGDTIELKVESIGSLINKVGDKG